MTPLLFCQGANGHDAMQQIQPASSADGYFVSPIGETVGKVNRLYSVDLRSADGLRPRRTADPDPAHIPASVPD
jgi:hypothetical protein